MISMFLQFRKRHRGPDTDDSPLDVHEWLMIHHTIIKSTGCQGGKYDVFAVAEFPIFAAKAEYINTSIGIPLGPVTVEVSFCRLPTLSAA